MSHHWLIPLAAIFAQLLFICGLGRRALVDRNSRLAVLVLLLVVGWNIGLFAFSYFPDAARAELWGRISRTWVCFAPPIVFHSTLLVFGYQGRVWRAPVVVCYLAATGLAIASAFGLLARGVTWYEYGWLPAPTPLYGCFTALLVLSFGVSLGLTAYRFVRPLTPLQRAQTRFHVLALVVMAPCLLTNLLAIYGFRVPPLGSVGSVLWSWTLAYAITRHRVVDIDYVVRKCLSFALACLPVVVPGALAMQFVGTTAAATDPVVLGFAAVTLAVVAGLVIPMVQQRLETQVQRALFRVRYDSRRRLHDFAAALVHVLDRGELVKSLGDGLAEILEPTLCEILLVDDRSRRVSLAYSAAPAADPLPDDVADALKTITEPVLAGELEGARAPAAGVFRRRGWELGLPLRVRDDAIGLIGLGPNRDLRIYSTEDIQLLARVAAGASVALENAKLSRLLRQSEAGLERANQLSSVGQLAAGIAHEIRNPLVAVKTFLDLLPERIDDRRFVNNFRDLSLKELKRVTTLISDLLALGKSTQMKRSTVALQETLEPVVRLMESAAQKRGVRLRQSVDPALPELSADADQLKQIVLNLLLNAIEVSPEDTEVHLALKRSPDAGEPTVLIEVQDEGPGIPKEHFEDIFHPFFTTKETGTGLGLSLVHQMVIEHGGKIAVESELGQGAVFRVTLPASAPGTAVVVPPVALRRTGT